MVARVRVFVGWVASVATLACIASCAAGVDSDPEADAWANFGSAGHASATGGASASGTGGHMAAGAAAMFTGESCPKPGNSDLCECMKPGSQGMRTCRQDSKSPTGASWGPCGTCVDPPPPKPDPGDVMATATGGRGGLRGGIGGLAGSPASGSGGTGGAMSSGSGGMGGSRSGGRDRTPPSGGGSCSCSDPCFPVGILPCCRIDGSCGCTWAPGAYCL